MRRIKKISSLAASEGGEHVKQHLLLFLKIIIDQFFAEKNNKMPTPTISIQAVAQNFPKLSSESIPGDGTTYFSGGDKTEAKLDGSPRPYP